MGFQSFTELEVYKECRRLRILVADLVNKSFPAEEKYRLSDQILRSSRRVTACIAEGHGRYYYKENIHFCRYARGSLSETLEHFITAHDAGYLTGDALKEYKEKIDTCTRLLNGYIRYLLKSKPPKEEDQNPT
jgi:four helix bundle protein